MSLQPLSPENLPTPKDEAWKYTNLPRAVPKGLSAEKTAPVLIHKNRGEACGEAVEILFTGRDGVLHAPVLKVTLEEGAELTLIERHDGDGLYWKNMVCEIDLAANAKFYHIRLQHDGAEGVHTDRVQITLGRDAVYEGFSLNAGGKLTRHDIHAVIAGENASCSFNGINLLKGVQHGDTTILIEHRAPHCTSNQFYRSLLADAARGVFQGKVHVHRAAQKTDGYQLSNAILLSPDAEMDTKPELEIYADDVKCSHGATTGQLDEEPLFYLRTRGLSAAEARQLLVQAFVDEVADKIGDETVQNAVKKECSAWLRTVL
jgi:Fe-S cluster assembly protein SufD